MLTIAPCECAVDPVLRALSFAVYFVWDCLGFQVGNGARVAGHGLRLDSAEH